MSRSNAHGQEALRAASRVRWRERVLRAAGPFLDLRGDRAGWAEGALILLYHRVSDDGDHRSDPFSVPRSVFDAHVAWLSERFHLLTVGEIAARVRSGGELRGLAALSFDDGYDCTFRNAWPVLRARDTPATLFVDTGRLDGRRPALTTRELRTMADEGMEVGSHTVSHVNVTRVAPSDLRQELERSAGDLRDALGRPVPGFAYPFGRYDNRAAELVRELGFEYACTCRQERTNHAGDDPFLLARTEINQGDVGRRFTRKIRGRHAPVYSLLRRLSPVPSNGRGP